MSANTKTMCDHPVDDVYKNYVLQKDCSRQAKVLLTIREINGSYEITRTLCKIHAKSIISKCKSYGKHQIVNQQEIFGGEK